MDERWSAGEGAAGPGGVPVTDAAAAGNALMDSFAAAGWLADDGAADAGVIAP
jgi:hypothetical protein